MAIDFTTALLRATNKAELIQVIQTYVSKANGYKNILVEIHGSRMEITADQDHDNGWERITMRTQLLNTDLDTGRDYYGRKQHCGLSEVDLTIIRNAIA